MRVTAIVTAYKEPKTIGKTIKSLSQDLDKNSEILVVAPDSETLSAVKSLKKSVKNLRTLKDLGRGKPAALNLAVKKSRGEILILTDGDVFVGKGAVKELLKYFKGKKIGAVSGRPISLDSKKILYGYWAHVLTQKAHDWRFEASRKRKRFFCTGYLFAIRKDLLPNLPEELLSEDGYISQKIFEKGFSISYAPKAEVFVKYPSNFDDWIKQKKRSAGGYNQIRSMLGSTMRSFYSESVGGLQMLNYISNFREAFWMTLLFLARIYLWILIYWEVDFKKKSQKELWKRVESTK